MRPDSAKKRDKPSIHKKHQPGNSDLLADVGNTTLYCVLEKLVRRNLCLIIDADGYDNGCCPATSFQVEQTCDGRQDHSPHEKSEYYFSFHIIKMLFVVNYLRRRITARLKPTAPKIRAKAPGSGTKAVALSIPKSPNVLNGPT